MTHGEKRELFAVLLELILQVLLGGAENHAVVDHRGDQQHEGDDDQDN